MLTAPPFAVQLFVNPDAISRQLLCVICGGVLENPVQTPCEHLFWCVVACVHVHAPVCLTDGRWYGLWQRVGAAGVVCA